MSKDIRITKITEHHQFIYKGFKPLSAFLIIISFISLIVLGFYGYYKYCENDIAKNYRTGRVIEGCEYIVNHTYRDREVLTHKGNCTNHKHNKENH